MNVKKQKVLTWLKSDRDYDSGLKLYREIGTNMAFKTMINRQPKSDKMFKQLCYELCKNAMIPELLMNQILTKPVVKETHPKPVEKKISVNDMPVEELALMIDIVDLSELDYNPALRLLSHLNIKPESRKKDDVIKAVNKIKLDKLNQEIPEQVRSTMKLREEFPFLASKDCPGDLKELVADMITAYDNYVTDHEKLASNLSEADINCLKPGEGFDFMSNELTEDEIKNLSKSVVENYLENRLIWKELYHYKEHGEILGEHPLFDWIHRRDDIKSMNQGDLVKLRDQLKNNIPRTKKLLRDEPDHKETDKRHERLNQMNKELDLVKYLLKIEQ